MDNNLNNDTNNIKQNFAPNSSNQQNNNPGMQNFAQTNNINANYQQQGNLQNGQQNVSHQGSYNNTQSNIGPVDTKLTEEEKGTISAVENLNKEDAMEEALSHTNQYPPFQEPKQEINKESENKNGKFSLVFLFVILAILGLFIINLPLIARLFGW